MQCSSRKDGYRNNPVVLAMLVVTTMLLTLPVGYYSALIYLELKRNPYLSGGTVPAPHPGAQENCSTKSTKPLITPNEHEGTCCHKRKDTSWMPVE